MREGEPEGGRDEGGRHRGAQDLTAASQLWCGSGFDWLLPRGARMGPVPAAAGPSGKVLIAAGFGIGPHQLRSCRGPERHFDGTRSRDWASMGRKGRTQAVARRGWRVRNGPGGAVWFQPASSSSAPGPAATTSAVTLRERGSSNAAPAAAATAAAATQTADDRPATKAGALA